MVFEEEICYYLDVYGQFEYEDMLSENIDLDTAAEMDKGLEYDLPE